MLVYCTISTVSSRILKMCWPRWPINFLLSSSDLKQGIFFWPLSVTELTVEMVQYHRLSESQVSEIAPSALRSYSSRRCIFGRELHCGHQGASSPRGDQYHQRGSSAYPSWINTVSSRHIADTSEELHTTDVPDSSRSLRRGMRTRTAVKF
jgi:hypothetical protein